jgi:signal transduction histidine kinase
MRETLADAYRAHLALLQAHMTEQWNQGQARVDATEPDVARFALCVRDGLAESAICFDTEWRITYPSVTPGRSTSESDEAAALQAQVRALAHTGDSKALARFVLAKFPPTDTTRDTHGRLISADAELLALEELVHVNDPDFKKIAQRLSSRAMDYQTDGMPSSQRRFIMHSLQSYHASAEYPSFTAEYLAAEDLAARFLEAEADATFVRTPGLHPTELPGVWSALSPHNRALELFTTAGVQSKLRQLIPDPSLPAGLRLSIDPPGVDAMSDGSVVAAIPAGADFPGWRLVLSVDDRTFFDTQASRRVQFLVSVACIVIAGISVLSVFIARGFGRQVRLARLKNDLVATVSHELKTPLTAIRALVDTLIDTPRLDEKTTREYLLLIATENARLSRLIENFLTFSRLDRNKLTFDFKPLNPSQIVSSAIAAFGERAHAHGCTLDCAVDPELPLINADSDALTTALLNLLDNAWKYTDGQKRIAIKATLRDTAVCFAVSDNGIGLSPRETRRIFRRFYQADQRLARAAGGCGLGLSIVHSIVAAHHGSVHVASQPGQGSTFTMEIPVP